MEWIIECALLCSDCSVTRARLLFTQWHAKRRGKACHFSGTLRSMNRCLRPVRALYTHQLRTVHAMREQSDRNWHAVERVVHAYFPLSLRTPRITPTTSRMRKFVGGFRHFVHGPALPHTI